MADSDLRNLFGLTITISYIKALSYSSSLAKLMCEAIAEGFNLSTSDGDTIFSYFRTEGHPENSVTAFSETSYTTYEQQVRDIIDAFLPTANDAQQEIITTVAHAMIFAYALNSANNLDEFQRLLGTVLSYVGATVLKASLFTVSNNVVVTPFTSDILQPLLENDYTNTLDSLKGVPRTIETRLTNYNWYDVSNILAGPDLTLMKDVENQYYYVSGVMLYEGGFGTVDSCIEDATTIAAWSGDVTFSYVRNTPCKDSSSYVGPVSLLKFKRVFNDGPSSSGYFTNEILEFYSGNDTAMLQKSDYLSNSYTLTTYTGSSPLASVFVDANGRYSIGPAEYLYAPRTYDCDPEYQRMHIGDNWPRTICGAKNCTCVQYNHVTGFKYASLEFPNTSWASELQFRQTNPLSDFSGLLKRAWSISDNPYVAEVDGDGVLWPYFKDVEENQYWYVGYPILNGVSALPQLAFFQTFSSPSFFNEAASVVIYPSIGTSDGGAVETAESSRSYEIGNLQMFSGQGALPIKFLQKIPSNLSGYNVATQKFFGMGTAFSGKYQINVEQEENAGFFYTGFTVWSNGEQINANTLASNYQNCIIGKYKTAKYISGYKRVCDGATFPLSNKFAKNASGDVFTYAYVAQSDVPSEIIQEDGWSYFAQVPGPLETATYERVYADQTVENYWPRFYDGPFSTETRKFLYPNAAAADLAFHGKTYGIPTGVTFKIKVREETVKEIYGEYYIYADGAVTSVPKNINVIRPDIIGGRTKNPVMRSFFYPDKMEDRFDYDFSYWEQDDEFDQNTLLKGLVDNNWAPKIESEYVPIGKNSNEYDDAVLAENLFKGGIKKTYDGIQTHITYGPAKSSTLSYSHNPMYEGLYHAFKYAELECSLAYVLPIFDLSQNAIVVNDGIQQAFPIQEDLRASGILVYRYQGNECTGNTGQDPLFFEYVGGRRGSSIASKEGGYHSQGIIGDRWNGMTRQQYGTARVRFGYTPADFMTLRYPLYDKYLLLFNTALSGTDLFVNGMSFAPFTRTRDTRPLTADMSFPYNIENGPTKQLDVITSGGFINFDLKPFFPERQRQKAAPENEAYYNTGFRLGPFDRDVELGLSRGEIIAAFSDLYINGQKITHWFNYSNDQERDWAVNIGINRTVQCGQASYNMPRNSDYTILAVIPSGQQAVFNIYSILSPRALVSIYEDTTQGNRDWRNDPAYTRIGMRSGAMISMRTHVPLDANTYEATLDSGEYNRLYSAFYVGNGTVTKYHIPHTQGLRGLAGKFQFIHTGKVGKLYPKPNSTDFAALATSDAYGNLIYPSNATVENYWKRYAIQNQQTITFSGYREGTRVMFEIYDVELKFDKIPYQSYELVVPSGNCILSGEMGYYAQADNCVFTEGFRLINGTPNDALASIYNPSYVSEVLSRMPASVFTYPTTISGHAPVLSAPSVMKQRENISGISSDQRYTYLLRAAPYNYNKLLWPALSDLETLNPGETMESIPPGDGNTFSSSTVLFSASQGQGLPNGLSNPDVSKSYYVQDIFQAYDSVATDALINSGICITDNRGFQVALSQNELSGALVPVGTPLGLIVGGLV